MQLDPEAPDTDPPPSVERTRPRFRHRLLPHKTNLHPYVRLSVAAAANVFLAVWVVPRLGAGPDALYSPFKAFAACLVAVVPSCTVVMVVLPVFVFGRDVPRLLAIGLAVLPGFVALAGICGACSLWWSGG